MVNIHAIIAQKNKVFPKEQSETDFEILKKEAMLQFEARKKIATEHVVNEALPAGSPMYFYCDCCGILTDVLPEEYLFTPSIRCSQCAAMKKQGMI